ncbi:tetraacyldisaccharide 4'-kinase [Acidovorax sp. 210-6]|uniref:tetraacyldisaccharide 4'-kinase n=1 Tax=Acidovorax sp. 210-6 TaxID=2699468 RepID=UPI00138974A3|nr:tetraacyldisaccharide 4'-kinase [Acidovorax sp. 210-6]NCU65940.1 tetraacyldisaccharide 4'-kinase [Acidovorax sp. 210-6]
MHQVSDASPALQRAWRQRGALACLLWPLSLLMGLLVRLRRGLYAARILPSGHPGVPVIVVGNVVAGGAGKTPVVMAVVRHLQVRGWRPGVVSRGYGRSSTDCRAVLPDSPPSAAGDEPLLIARQCKVPVFVASQRLEAAQALRQSHPDIDIIVCDDGLQHLALARNIEVCVFNNDGVGNGWLLPAGPLREPWPRPVDLVVHAGTAPKGGSAPCFAMQRSLAPTAVRADGSQVPLHQLQAQPLLALAGIARPRDFFALLQQSGLEPQRTLALPDHYDYDSWQRPSDKPYTLICTEKDAAKLWRLHPDALAVPLRLEIAPGFFEALDAKLAALGSLSSRS